MAAFMQGVIIGAIVQGVAKRAVDGNASSEQAMQLGKFVQPMAELALEVIDRGKAGS